MPSIDLAVPMLRLRPDAIVLIKLDVEGAEPDALRGAASLIARARPRLAVSTYHLPEHHFELLLQMHALTNGEAKLHLRSHGYQSFDTVAYALFE